MHKLCTKTDAHDALKQDSAGSDHGECVFRQSLHNLLVSGEEGERKIRKHLVPVAMLQPGEWKHVAFGLNITALLPISLVICTLKVCSIPD